MISGNLNLSGREDKGLSRVPGRSVKFARLQSFFIELTFRVPRKPDLRPALFDDYNRVSVEILLTDVDLALTFTDLARTHSDQRAKSQSTRNARKAYDSVIEKRCRFVISKNHSKELDSKLDLLKAQLVKLGEKFE